LGFGCLGAGGVGRGPPPPPHPPNPQPPIPNPHIRTIKFKIYSKLNNNSKIKNKS